MVHEWRPGVDTNLAHAKTHAKLEWSKCPNFGGSWVKLRQKLCPTRLWIYHGVVYRDPHIIHGTGIYTIYTDGLLIFVVNVGKYTIYGLFGWYSEVPLRGCETFTGWAVDSVRSCYLIHPWGGEVFSFNILPWKTENCFGSKLARRDPGLSFGDVTKIPFILEYLGQNT